ncbi:hypothetical protein [Jiella pelagia]|uniref:Uncharacterized protein n=1 Tax=Jiella pelagia TaxID=2986949 RepID=A0ABY7BXL8_9HYPH|nr:hypothetical protein [Jiella pelagia]WAP68579.1 hypothetical protein OH818_25400 [Jiella pelagia]
MTTSISSRRSVRTPWISLGGAVELGADLSGAFADRVDAAVGGKIEGQEPLVEGLGETAGPLRQQGVEAGNAVAEERAKVVGASLEGFVGRADDAIAQTGQVGIALVEGADDLPGAIGQALSEGGRAVGESGRDAIGRHFDGIGTVLDRRDQRRSAFAESLLDHLDTMVETTQHLGVVLRKQMLDPGRPLAEARFRCSSGSGLRCPRAARGGRRSRRRYPP